MTRWARCELDDVTVQGTTGGRRLGRGAIVDLHEVVSPGLTMGEALGDLARHFRPLDAPPAPLEGLPADDADAFSTETAAEDVRLPEGTETALVDPGAIVDATVREIRSTRRPRRPRDEDA